MQNRSQPGTAQSRDATASVAPESNGDPSPHRSANRLNRDLDDTGKLEVQLAQATRELESLAYAVSHDLRAPLRAIEGFSRILLEDHPDVDTETRRYLAIIASNASAMNRLIDDLLAYSRLLHAPVNMVEIDVGRMVAEVVGEIKAAQSNRAVEVKTGALPPCVADEALLRQVWVHLISNAFKFTEKTAQPRIEIGGELSADGKENVYHVNDNGAGFDMRYAGKLFAVFQRLHRADEFSGSGIGLAMAQRILNAHEGRIWCEAVPNDGATFLFALPHREI